MDQKKSNISKKKKNVTVTTVKAIMVQWKIKYLLDLKSAQSLIKLNSQSELKIGDINLIEEDTKIE